jgi:tripartite-type tricarboxylate transporter receptor subunit TctC
MIDAGRARSLAILAAERNPQFPNVPTLDEQMGPHKSVGVWRGIAGPKGLPPEIQDKLVSVLKEVYASKEYKDFMSGRGFGIQWAEKAEFGQFMDESDRQMGEAMKAAGLAKA